MAMEGKTPKCPSFFMVIHLFLSHRIKITSRQLVMRLFLRQVVAKSPYLFNAMHGGQDPALQEKEKIYTMLF